MARNEFFTKMQAGLELTYGAGGAATAFLLGQAPRVTTDTKLEMVTEQMDSRQSRRRAIPYQRLYTNTRSLANAGYQDLIFPFETGLKHVTASEDTPGQGDYEWNWSPGMTPAAGANSPKSFVAQIGDDEQAWIVKGCHTDRISLKGSIAQDGGSAAVSLEQSFFGQYIAEGSFTSSLAPGNSQPLNAKLARLYWDTAYGSIGGTEVTDGLIEFTFEMMTGMHPKFRGGANNYPSAAAEGAIDWTLALKLDTALRDEMFDAHRNGGMGYFSLAIDSGVAIGTGQNHILTINMAAFLEDVTPIDGADRSDNLSSVALTGTYDKANSFGLYVDLFTDRNSI